MNEYEEALKDILDSEEKTYSGDSVYLMQELVQRATPTKPVVIGAKHSLIFMGCPVCKDRTSIVDNFCPKCGQAIDLGDKK